MAVGISVPAFAAEAVTETVVVTGSRIPVSNLTNPSPVSVKGSDAIQMTAAKTLEDVLKTMTGPDVLGLSNNSNNGGVGLSTISVRGLGAPRTLVLIDGERLVPVFVGSTSTPDINSVPIPMIERVEVLRDGASSVYGADAIGGVVNIITKKDFSGLQFDVSGNASQHGGADGYSMSATMGSDFDKGNVTFAVMNEWTSALGQWERDWSTVDFVRGLRGSISRSQPPTLKDETGSDIWVHGVNGTTSTPALNSQVPCSFTQGGTTLRLNASCYTPEGGWNTLQGSLGRTQFSVNGHYDITPDVTFVLQATLTDRRSGQQLRPEPLLGDSLATVDVNTSNVIWPGFFVPRDPHWGWPGGGNIGAPANTQACPTTDPNGCLAAFDTPIQFGPRTYRQVSDTYRIRAGFEGKIFGDYHWEAGYVQQRNTDANKIFNSGNFYHLAEAMGQIPCVDVPGGCTAGPAFGHAFSVPLAPPNFYNEPNGLTPEQVAYLTTTNFDRNESIENYAYANIEGPVFQLPAGEMSAALGVERRFEHLSDTPDTLVQLGYGPGLTLPTSGGYGVWSIYGELQIPVLKDMFLAKSVDFDLSGRYDHYSTFGDSLTYKASGNWTVNDDVRFRGSYSTGFRAPSTAELFGGRAVSFNTVDGDPCDSRTVINGNSNMPATLAEAAARLAPGTTCFNALTAIGLTPPQIAVYQSAENNLSSDQRGLILGGNPLLKPEKSFGWTIGTVVTPQFLPGSSFAADYYETTVKNAIQGGGGVPGAQGLDQFVNNCYGPTQAVANCAAISRNPNGIFQILGLNANFGAQKVRGLEMQLAYDTLDAGLDLPVPGSFNFNLEVAREFQNDQILPSGTIKQSGTFNTGVEANFPAWRSVLNIDWTMEAWNVHWDTEWYSHTHNQDGSPATFGNVLPDNWNNNISVSYDLADWVGTSSYLKSSRVIFGINNLFDTDPPFLTSDSICKCNSFAGAGYDFVGRSFYIRLTGKM
jgi:iron complex outermembrane receptor protein